MTDPEVSGDSLTVGVDLGGTRIKAGLVDPLGRVLAATTTQTPRPTEGTAAVTEVVVAAVRELLVPPVATRSAASRTRIAVTGVGVGVAGLVDAARGTVVFAPHLSFRETPLRAILTRHLGLPVVVDNDANAAAWAEHRFGAGRDESHLLMLTLGTGIGGAILTDGRLQRGRHGLAGELGHVQVEPEGRACECGGRGCWEQYVSGSVLRREGQSLVRAGGPVAAALHEACGGDPLRLRGDDVTRVARAGDPASRRILTDAGRWLGLGVAGAVATLDPGTVVIGGGLAEAGGLLLDPAREVLAQHLLGRGHRPAPPVLPSALGPLSGMVGAADLARHR